MKRISAKLSGALGNGIDDDTEFLQKAIRKAASCKVPLYVEKGRYLTGPLDISSSIEIIFEEGSELVFIPGQDRYPPVLTRWEGVDCHAFCPCIFIHDATDVSIHGKGRICGSGVYWWNELLLKRRRGQKGPESLFEKKLASLNAGYEQQPGGGGGREIQFLRPDLIGVIRSDNISIEGLILVDSPFWTLHTIYSNNIRIVDVSISNPPSAPNTDGMDIDSCCNVLIRDCVIDVGDDGIALKSGSGQEGIAAAAITENIRIESCLVTNAHGGVVVGSETAAGIRNVRVSGCTFIGTDRGIRIKTRRGRGGRISDMVFEDIVMKKTICPITINMYYSCGATKLDCFTLDRVAPASDTPSIRNIMIRGIMADGIRSCAAFIIGLPESPIEGLCFSDSSFSLAGEEMLLDVRRAEMYYGLPDVEKRGVRLRNAYVSISNLHFEGFDDAVLILEEGAAVR